MDHFAGLDVSVKETSVCIVDDTGRVVRLLARALLTSSDRGGSSGFHPYPLREANANL